MDLRPAVNLRITIGETAYTFTEHPAAKGMPYGQSGRRATVYQLRAADGGLHAIKIFTESFREARVAETADKLLPFASMPGLQVCRRRVLTPESDAALIGQYENLRYAALMPWVYGETWQEFMLGAQPLEKEHSRLLAQSLAHILANMEARQMAHGDLSGPNVLLPGLQAAQQPASGDSLVALVDVEDIYAPGLPQPQKLPGGSSGYAHPTTAEGIWAPDADRFAGGILLAEMLTWCDADVVQIAYGEQYFDPDELQQNSERYQLMLAALRRLWGSEYAALLTRLWGAATLSDCPPLSAWAQLLGEPEAAIIQVRAASAPATAAQPIPIQTPQEQLARSHIERADVYLSIGQVERALKELEEAYRTLPEVGGEALARALRDQAEAKERMGSLPAALQDYRRALAVAPPGILRSQLQSAEASLSARLSAAGIPPEAPSSSTHPLTAAGRPPQDAIATAAVEMPPAARPPRPRQDAVTTVAVEMPPAPAPRKRRLSPLAWIGIILGALAVCGAGVFFTMLIFASLPASPEATPTPQTILTTPPTAADFTATPPPAEEPLVAPPTPLPSDTPAPTPTPPGLTFFEDFSKSGKWITVKDPTEADAAYAPGSTYFIHIHRPQKIFYSIAPLPVETPPADIVASVTFTTPLNPKGEVGILCRVQDDYNFYRIGVYASSGQYRISKFFKGNYTYLTKLKYTDAFKTKSQSENKITAACIGDTIRLSINDVQVAEVRDADLTSGNTAIYAATYDGDSYNANLGFKAVFNLFTLEEVLTP
ncbi:MAG: hypothetical protein HPY45_13275 [Anaerolineae bacterium]|nr:hypothetical protein [Anaerolineae bacterium]